MSTEKYHELSERARRLKAKGFTTTEIADELNVQPDTVLWLLMKEHMKEKPAGIYDFHVDWSQIGSNLRCLTLAGYMLAEVARSALESKEFEETEVIIGVEPSGIPLALLVADELEKPMAVMRPRRHADKEGAAAGAICLNFSKVEGRRALIVDDVVNTGETLRVVVQSLRELNSRPVGILTLVDKKARETIDGVPVKTLIKAVPIGTT